MAKKKPAAKSASVPVEAHTHVADSRKNIPTRELAEFAATDGIGKAIYNRDRSLDPQLVWKGKDEQDAKGALEVPAVPIYVQEKVHPRAIVDDLKSRAAAARPADNLFADFNGLDDFSKKLEFYQHDQHWTNRLILGDSLLVMASLAEKERLRGQVQCVYFDPPYGIKFGSNWQVSTRKRDVKDAKAEDLTRQPEQVKAFRDTWELGIHSYLTYIRDRLALARDLLTESGSIFVQIGDENVHLVRGVLDEVFGRDNFISLISFATTTGFESKFLGRAGDRLLWYGKEREQTKYHDLYQDSGRAIGGGGYRWITLPDGSSRALTSREINGECEIPSGGRLYVPDNIISQGASSQDQTFDFGGKQYHPGLNSHWKARFPDGMNRLGHANRLHVSANSLRFVRYADDFPFRVRNNVWTDTQTGQFTDDKLYVVQTNTKVVERCLLMTTDPGDLVLDPTCGSGTTAYVAEQWGRRWITIDTSRVALSLARQRLMAARFPYYLLADSTEGRKKQAEVTATALDPKAPPPQRDLHRGFVYKTVPHVTLKSIANNPDIKPGMTRDQINAAIARHADSETLYDQPYEDKSVVRLTGPFTVESLSPHRALPIVGPQKIKETKEVAASSATRPLENYLGTVTDNLRKAGVKGTDKSQRIAFARLDPFPGEYIQAEGEAGDGMAVRVSIGPETGTVGDAWIKHAAIDAIKGSKCDLLLVCAFAFEASVHEQTAELKKEMKFGKLRILPVRMNPDLAMFGDDTGKELLKKTGNANLFTVFGEPDLKIDTGKGGTLTVTVRGVDVFDPATAEVRTGGTDDIACWFIDTDYNGESFFVRHAYFLQGGKNTDDGPYEKLKKALRAEIDEAEWSKLYRATSQPFAPPSSGRIAVKVINHFGDEVLKVCPVPARAAGKSQLT
ncbi:dna methylase : DNA methyltransferase OS=Dehalococcoides mccartyi GY50 GN=GY50_1041 PE=4 SV=1: N6_N4_Mtase [Gemmataceae bacterium]|nr:dna methylase : DNA methyltransferase OS=Dehalococcoides mccartyi GY50 GN=GY50_1041 PE=4 SV=1: N6_N4_Mtase [Gemmataceae bacterium]VTU00861.1 dna methylase : DNA methyltransferase OS=Dehalococcoides mccartyi GY50 GN=GY50_1041 PE=4 SV=1: N6_N4_Mtase [Gemmataceae bacterium]